MAWEKRGNQQYYYRKHKIDGHVVSDYIGFGSLAESQSQNDQANQQARQAEREARRHEFNQILEQDREIDLTCALIYSLTRTILLATGYHIHKGQWRKKRHDKRKSSS